MQPHTRIALLLALALVPAGELRADCPIDPALEHAGLNVSGQIHFNINVSDFERSRHFYRVAGFTDEVGGFPETNTIEVSRGVGLDALYRIKAELIFLGELPEGPVDLTVPTGRFIDLIEWMEPHRPDPPYASIHHLGITHFTLRVPDIEPLSKRLREAGGTLAGHVLGDANSPGTVMMRDPDGTFLRLDEAPVPAPEIGYLSLNVTDLECSRKFYALLGLEPEPAPADPAATDLYEAMGMEAGSERRELVMRHRIDGSRIKLNQWVQPVSPGQPYPAPINHLGLGRVNWASTRLEDDVARLRGLGIEFLSDIAPCCEGDASRFGFIVFADPDGIYNQLMGAITPPAQVRAAADSAGED